MCRKSSSSSMNPKHNQVVVNYNSKSYESVLFRSPNSPPPSPSPLPPPSVAYLNHLFFTSSLHRSRNSSFLLPPLPPLLPLPPGSLRSARTKQKAKRNRAAVNNKVTEKKERRVESVLSPPPSSLPLPRFSLRQSKADAGGGDGGARSCIAEVAKGGGGGGGEDYHELMQMLSF